MKGQGIKKDAKFPDNPDLQEEMEEMDMLEKALDNHAKKYETHTNQLGKEQ